MNTERHSHRLKIALATTGAVLALSGSFKPLTENTYSDSNGIPNDKSTEQLVPVPCTEPMPWEQPLSKNNSGQTGEIQLSSVKKPEPTPNRYQPECWIIVKDNEVIFEQ